MDCLLEELTTWLVARGSFVALLDSLLSITFSIPLLRPLSQPVRKSATATLRSTTF